ncbi:kinesin-related protein 4 isoform X7 [Malaya genurostris]|uniref:kinesin-related protein 4 isoform X7 n=1 Tax=Malaya genurostris TaxID=325434 RepID=UPI0026F39016|nr:kinesin-related protein 4 isoform X7 [Malaya genurostris]
MSGDVQPRKRKDKKRKKDDEDTVKETSNPKHAPSSAAQISTQPGDIQMHIHSDHGTGGNWCAKIVFFLLLTGLGVLIGLILIENRGVSNADTPLSESRYAEYLSGWVDENREDDHHEEILNAINQLEEEDHDDEDHDDDGEPYAEEEDHDDEQEAHDKEEEEEPQKLDDDEVEEIVATEQQEPSLQESKDSEDIVEDEDDDNENDNADNEDEEGGDDDDDDEDDYNDVENEDIEADGEDDDNEAVSEPKPIDENNEENDEIQDDEDNNDKIEDQKYYTGKHDAEDADDSEDEPKDQQNENNDPIDDEDDRRSADAIAKEIDELAEADEELPFEEEANKQKRSPTTVHNHVQQKLDPSNEFQTQHILKDVETKPKDPVVSAEILATQMDELVENYNKLAEMLNVPAEVRVQHEIDTKDDDDDDGDGNDDVEQDVSVNDDNENDKYNVNDDDDDDDDDDGTNDLEDEFENVVDNDDGEEEYLSKVRQEQELKNQINDKQKEDEPREEVSLAVQLFVGAALVVAAHLLLKPPRGVPRSETAVPSKSTAKASTVSKLEEQLTRNELAMNAANRRIDSDVNELFINQTKDFDRSTVNIEDFVKVEKDEHTGDQPFLENADEGQDEISYSGEEDYDFDQDEYTDELEEIEEEEEEETEEYAKIQEMNILEQQEREIGTFVPTTFEEFSAMYRPDAAAAEVEAEAIAPSLAVQIAETLPVVAEPVPVPTPKNSKKNAFKESPLLKKKPPKGAVGKLIYGLHKDPIISAKDIQTASEKDIPSRPSGSQTYEEELRKADRQLDEFRNAKRALASYEDLLIKQPRLIAALVGKARALDLLAEQEQSNIVLGEAIEAYRDVIMMGQAIDDDTLKAISERCIERIRFRGQYLKAIDIHQVLIKRFDTEPKYRNQLAVTYLMANRLVEAKAVLHETLMRWIEDGFALVHYGFVLKNHDKNMELAVQYLQEGIETGHEGTQDGRFYFHLGDALQRLGRNDEALEVYQKGAEQKLFLSMYQRSLYNEDSLKSRPFWTIEQTTFASQLNTIQSQWTAIRDEGLKLLNAAGTFRDEAENLRDRGDWKQFELFMRGYRIDKNCAKAPLTCKLVEQFTAARTCKRGQIKFSVMQPGTHVWPHCGPTNCRIRAHLGLMVPDGVSIRVANETRHWENGRWLIFDDSYEHEVWHNGTDTRLVLIVDFWHPDLNDNQRKTLSPI